MNEILEFSLRCRIDTINSFGKLKHLFVTRGRKPYRSYVPLCGTICRNALKNESLKNFQTLCEKILSKPVNRHFYCYIMIIIIAILFPTYPDPSAVLN